MKYPLKRLVIPKGANGCAQTERSLDRTAWREYRDSRLDLLATGVYTHPDLAVQGIIKEWYGPRRENHHDDIDEFLKDMEPRVQLLDKDDIFLKVKDFLDYVSATIDSREYRFNGAIYLSSYEYNKLILVIQDTVNRMLRKVTKDPAFLRIIGTATKSWEGHDLMGSAHSSVYTSNNQTYIYWKAAPVVKSGDRMIQYDFMELGEGIYKIMVSTESTYKNPLFYNPGVNLLDIIVDNGVVNTRAHATLDWEKEWLNYRAHRVWTK